MPANSVKHPGVVGLPIVAPEFWRQVNMVTVRGRPYSPAVGALLREALRVKWFGQPALVLRRVSGGVPEPPVASIAPASVDAG